MSPSPEKPDLHGIEKQPFPSFDETCTYLEGVTVQSADHVADLIRQEFGYEDETFDLEAIHMHWVEKKPKGTLMFEGPGWYECASDDDGALPFWKDRC